ncbi:MAG: hypothetical protein IZT55_04685 [Anaerolineae bacterium]|nr:hypothetical protein [Anaerolineae bacterium]
MAEITKRIAQVQGNILAITTSSIQNDLFRELTIKVVGADPDSLLKKLQSSGFDVVDFRIISSYEPRLFGL